MKKYRVTINGIVFEPEASNRAVAIRRSLDGYYYDDTVPEDARKKRRKDTVGREIRITITRIE